MPSRKAAIVSGFFIAILGFVFAITSGLHFSIFPVAESRASPPEVKLPPSPSLTPTMTRPTETVAPQLPIVLLKPSAAPSPSARAVVSTVTPTPDQLKQTSSRQDLRVVASGFGQTQQDVGYAFLIDNLTGDLAVTRSSYSISVYGAANEVLGTDSGTIGVVLPSQHLGVAGRLRLPKPQVVTHIAVTVRSSEYAVVTNLPPALTSADVTWHGDSVAPLVEGVVMNPFQQPVTQVRVSAIAYDATGKIIGGGSSTIASLPANRQSAVKVPVTTASPPAEVEMYAMLSSLATTQ